MTIKKYDSDDSNLWTNSSGSVEYVHDPGKGGDGSTEMPSAKIDLTGIVPTVQTVDAYGAEVQVIKIPPAQMTLAGTPPPTLQGVDVSIPIPPAEVEFAGVETSQSHLVTAIPAKMDIDGGDVVAGHGVVAPPAGMTLAGIVPPTLQGLSVSIPITPASMELSGVAPNSLFNYLTATYSLTIKIPKAEMTLEGVPPTPAHGVVIPPAEMDLNGLDVVPAHGVVVTTADMTLAGVVPRIKFSVPSDIPKTKFYNCVLTGDADSTTDITLPVTSISIRLRDGEPTYCGVVVPNSDRYSSYINARLNGDLVIYQGYRFLDGSENQTEVVRVDLEDVATDKGTRKSSIQLAGHRTDTNPSPQTIDVRPIQAYSVQKDGARRIRSQVAFFFEPGDTVIYGDDPGDYFVAGLITISVGKNFDKMDVTEDISSES